ncbi:penicillin-binding protein, partial [Enterococcus faecalis]|nr:penicillin-binding protein [Enterococcus faecalis]
MAKFDFEKLKNIQNNEKVKSLRAGTVKALEKSGLAKLAPFTDKILNGIKIGFNILFVLGLLGGAFAAGAARGYVGSLFEEVEPMDQASLVSRVSEVTG